MIDKFIKNYEFNAKDIARPNPYMKVISSDRVRKILKQAMKEEFERGRTEGCREATSEAAEEIRRNYTYRTKT